MPKSQISWTCESFLDFIEHNVCKRCLQPLGKRGASSRSPTSWSASWTPPKARTHLTALGLSTGGSCAMYSTRSHGSPSRPTAATHRVHRGLERGSKSKRSAKSKCFTLGEVASLCSRCASSRLVACEMRTSFRSQAQHPAPSLWFSSAASCGLLLLQKLAYLCLQCMAKRQIRCVLQMQGPKTFAVTAVSCYCR